VVKIGGGEAVSEGISSELIIKSREHEKSKCKNRTNKRKR